MWEEIVDFTRIRVGGILIEEILNALDRESETTYTPKIGLKKKRAARPHSKMLGSQTAWKH